MSTSLLQALAGLLFCLAGLIHTLGARRNGSSNSVGLMYTCVGLMFIALSAGSH